MTDKNTILHEQAFKYGRAVDFVKGKISIAEDGSIHQECVPVYELPNLNAYTKKEHTKFEVTLTSKVSVWTKMFLGEYNTTRLYRMLECESGWDDLSGKGEPLKQESLDSLNWFARNIPITSDYFSIFMSLDGIIRLDKYESIDGLDDYEDTPSLEIEFKAKEIKMWFAEDAHTIIFKTP